MASKSTFRKALVTFKEYLLITVGLLLYTLAWAVFLLPNNLVGGGITGLGSIIQYSTGFNVAYSYIIINTILVLIAMKVLGGGFGAKTIYALIVTALFLRFLPGMVPQEFITNFTADNGKLMCVIFAGAMVGLGIALTFAQGGSTGGTDIIALMVSKFYRVSPGTVIAVLDLLIIGSSMLIPNGASLSEKLLILLYGFVLTGVTNYTLDFAINGRRQSVQLFIFSEQYETLTDRICNEIHRGVTLLESQGGYSKHTGKLVVVIVKRTETSKILKLIKEVDPDAFISIGNVSEVYGKGFEPIKKS
ncbi:MAG: YitT family protein [Bacteroidales bacterium]|nr:YitT family protein [Bacteroidales bacterium]